MSPSVLAKPLNVAAIDAKLYTLHGHVRDWVQGIRWEDEDRYAGRIQPNPLECAALIDELLELRYRQTTTKEPQL